MNNISLDFKKCTGITLIVVLLGMYAVFVYMQNKKASYIASIEGVILQQQEVLANLSALTDRNAVDFYAAGIIADCPTEERIRFDELLGTLDQLKRSELLEVKALFTGCASYDAQQKALMTARLEREVEIYKQLTSVLNDANMQNSIPNDIEKWSQIIDFEKQRTKLSQQLVQIQRDIIINLLDGKTPQSPEIRTLLEQAQEAKETFSYIRIKIDTLRSEINPT